MILKKCKKSSAQKSTLQFHSEAEFFNYVLCICLNKLFCLQQDLQISKTVLINLSLEESKKFF